MLIDVDREVRRAAAEAGPTQMRSLDAIHLASTLLVRDRLSAFVTYDRRLADVAGSLGLPVESPR